MKKAYIFAGVGSAPAYRCLDNRIRHLKPCGGSASTRELTGFLFYSRANTLAFPDKGEILLNRREGLLRFATRYEPKHKPYGQPQTMQGKVDQSPLRGVGGLICFSRPSASVS